MGDLKNDGEREADGAAGDAGNAYKLAAGECSRRLEREAKGASASVDRLKTQIRHGVTLKKNHTGFWITGL